MPDERRAKQQELEDYWSQGYEEKPLGATLADFLLSAGGRVAGDVIQLNPLARGPISALLGELVKENSANIIPGDPQGDLVAMGNNPLQRGAGALAEFALMHPDLVGSMALGGGSALRAGVKGLGGAIESGASRLSPRLGRALGRGIGRGGRPPVIEAGPVRQVPMGPERQLGTGPIRAGESSLQPPKGLGTRMVDETAGELPAYNQPIEAPASSMEDLIRQQMSQQPAISPMGPGQQMGLPLAEEAAPAVPVPMYEALVQRLQQLLPF